jgi:hypothetical protein
MAADTLTRTMASSSLTQKEKLERVLFMKRIPKIPVDHYHPL